jgi:hypothetical protein
MTLQLKKAERKKAKIRLGLSGASGFGKTYTSLLIAKGLVGDWEKIAMIDTEHGSGELYADLGDYNVITLNPPYSPERYIEAIKACEQAGMECIIIDSITHEWDGPGGCLEILDKLGGKYQDWAKITPRHNAFINAILTSKSHVITTVRRKQDYEMTKDNNGKIKVEKAGTKEITREGFEYELTVNLEIANDRHMVRASKDRTGLFMDKPEFIPTVETGELIRKWCESGKEPEIPQKAELTPNHKHWTAIQKRLAEGSATLMQIEENYRITDENKELLLELAAS